MQRRDVLAGLILVLGTGQAAFAQDYVAAILRDLEAEGYSAITTERTLLGRVRILAENAQTRREIIVNPRTGEVLRDLWLALDGTVIAEGRLTDAGDDPSGEDDGGSDDDSGDDDSGDDRSEHQDHLDHDLT